MKILVISYEYPPLGGGGGVAVAEYARAWVRRGHSVTVITSAGADLALLDDDLGVAIHRVAVPGRHSRATASLPSLLAFPPLAVRFALQQWQPADFDVI